MAGKRTYLRELNPQLVCPLCRGYLIDATTVVECLHSFCRSCILKHLRKDAQCPSCKILLNTAKPNIKADKALQDIVYKLVPGLYHKEMRKRREFYSKHPDHADSATPEQRGEDVSGRLIFAPEDAISLSLEYLPVGADPLALLSSDTEMSANQKQKINGGLANRRYLQCPALVTIAHLKKFLGLKYSVDMTRYNIDICHRRAPLPEHWTLMDVAYIFAWKRNAPIRFFYRITQEEQRLEAPPNDRPSTPGLGASQPATAEQADDPVIEDKKDHPKPDDRGNEATKTKEREQAVAQPTEPAKPETLPQKPSEAKRTSDPKKVPELLAKRTTPSAKEQPSVTSNVKQSPPMSSLKANEEASLKQQVKSPIKIMKNSDGRYEVLRAPSVPARTSTAATPESAATKAEFSVVSIGDGANSNGVKIKLKQCQPSGTATGNTSSKKPKVISNVLLRNSNDCKSQPTHVEQELRQKRKVTFMDSVADSPAAKRRLPETDKKQFLQGFRLAAAAKESAAKESAAKESAAKKSAAKESAAKESPAKESAAEKNILKNAEGSKQEKAPTTQKKRQMEVKMTSTNIAERLGEAKHTLEGNSSPAISSSSNDQQIDVYAFPNDPPAAVPAGAVKRKCPPGLPIFEMRKKQQQQQQQQQQQYHSAAGKRAGANTPRNNSSTPVKCYRNQSAKPMVYAKPPPSPARALQSLSNPIGNVANVNANATPAPIVTPTISSTSPKNPPTSSPIMISSDTRNLLDGCGLNIPASLSITLTAPKSPSRGNDPTLEFRGKEGQSSLDKLSPSITLNDKSVDPRVLKALKAGQMRMPLGNVKSKGKQQQEQGPSAKRKKEDTQQQQQQPRNILDLSGTKKMEIHPLRIPTPLGKYKAKPPTWSQANSSKPPGKDDPPSYTANGQVVTLTGGQRFYRAPPGSLTPAVHRISDIPTPSRAPVYAPCFSSPSASPRPAPANLSSVFPSLQSLYALSQAPSLEQFHMDSRMRMAAAAAAAAKDGNSSSTNSTSGGQMVSKSHIAAQCAPVKPARSSVGSFAVPIAKQSVKVSKSTPAASTNSADGEMSTSSTDSDESKGKKSENSKEAPSKSEIEQGDNCASSSEESSSQQGAASPRVTSTASPSPPPETVSNAMEKSSSKSSEKRQSSSSSGAEVTSSNKSPESPDSSSVVTENLVDSTKPSPQEKETSPKSAETKSTAKDEQQQASSDAKSKGKTEEFKKPMTSEALQKRFLAAFPSNEWANNPIAAEQFGNFLKSLSTMQAEAQPKNAKTVE